MKKHDPVISPALQTAFYTATRNPASLAAPSSETTPNPLAELAMRLANFDEAAYEEFWVRFASPLNNLFKSCGVPATEDEDLTCDCLDKAIRKIHQYQPRPGKSLSDWVFKIAYNRMKDWLRRQKTRLRLDGSYEEVPPAKLAVPVPLEENEDDPESPSPSEVYAAVNEAKARLTAAEREVLDLRYSDHISNNQELAARLGIKVNAAKTRLSRAMSKLKAHLEKDPRIKLRKI